MIGAAASGSIKSKGTESDPLVPSSTSTTTSAAATGGGMGLSSLRPPLTAHHAAMDDDSSDGGRGDKFCLPTQFWPTLAFAGIQLAWAIMYAYITPSLLSYDLDINLVGCIWFVASFASLVVCPLVGAASDYTSHPWGRRRIYMLTFLPVACGGLVLLAYSERLGAWLGDVETQQNHALVMSIAGLTMAEVGMDVIAVMERALLTDVLEAGELQGANAFFSLTGTSGRLLGYALGATTLSRLPGLSLLGSQIQILFLLAAAFLFATTALTLAFAHERPFIPQLYDLFNAGLVSSAKRAALGTKSLPKAVRRAFVSNVLNWSGWAILFFFASDWMAFYVYGGNAEDTGNPASDYERGLQAASLAYLLMAAVGAVISPCLAALCGWLGFRRVWAASLLWAAAVFAGIYFVRAGDRVSATALIACLGVPLAASYQLPWTCVTLAVRRSEDSALFCTLFRLSEVLPIALMGFLSAVVLSIFKGQERVAFLVAALLLLTSAAYTATCTLDLEEINEYEED